MTRYAKFGPRDEQPVQTGDRGWRGVNMRIHPTLLPEGMAAEAVNMRFRNGVPQARGGCSKLPFINNFDLAYPYDINAYGTIYGQGTFSDPDDVTWHLVAADGEVYRRLDANAPTSVPLPPESPVQYPVTFIQAIGQCLMLRGPRFMPLVMTDTAVGFANLTDGLTNFRFTATYGTTPKSEVVWPPQPGFDYSDTDTYAVGDLVMFVEQYWTPNTTTVAGESPSTAASKWDLMTWQSDATYVIGKQRVFHSTLFEAVVDAAAGESPLSNPEKWEPVTHKLYQSEAVTTAGETPVSAPSKWSFTRDLMPYASTGIFVQERIFVIYDRHLIAFSDAQDIGVTVLVANTIPVNKGSSDGLLALGKFNDYTIIAFKTHSVHGIENVYGTLSAVTVNEVTRAYGLVGAKAFCNVGKDLWFLSQRGVVSLVQTEQNKIQGVNLPMSDPIQPLIDRINWRLASLATAVYWDNKFYLAVPLDAGEVRQVQPHNPLLHHVVTYNNLVPGAAYYWVPNDTVTLYSGTVTATEPGLFRPELADAFVDGIVDTYESVLYRLYTNTNNAVLVFDFLNGEWCGVDQGEQLVIQDWFLADCSGQERLFFTGNDGFCNLYEQGNSDAYLLVRRVLSDEEPIDQQMSVQEIETSLTTRAYGADGLKRWEWAEFHLATWAPEFSITALFPGGFESKELYTDVIRNRAKYIRPFNRANYDTTNEDDDHAEPYREDYSVDFETSQMLDGEGVTLDQFQDYTFRKRLIRMDSSIQFRIRNTQGKLQILEVKVDGQAARRRTGTFV